MPVTAGDIRRICVQRLHHAATWLAMLIGAIPLVYGM
jgi:hypothetical protein